MSDELRLPPQDRYAEQQVLSAVLNDPQCVDAAAGRLAAEDFYFAEHQMVFRAAVAMADRQVPADAAAVFEHLRREGRADDVTPAYMGELVVVNPTGIGWEHYAGIVQDAARRRRLIRLCGEMARDAYDVVEPAADLVARFEQRVFEVATGEGRAADESVLLEDAMREALSDMESRVRGDDAGVVPTGFPSLDAVVGGLKPGQLVVVAARPGGGKTASALCLALNVVTRPGSATLFFSMEMSAAELAGRALAVRASVPLHVVLNGRDSSGPISQDQVDSLIAATARSPSQLRIVDRSHLSAADVSRAVRQARRRHGVRLVVVDYAQRMRHDRAAGDSLAAQIGDSVKAMKTLARDAAVPVVLLAQLNRDAAAGEPTLAMLKGSGDLEQEADTVVLLHSDPPQPGAPPSRVQRVKFIVAKQRNGPCATVELDYVRRYTRFEEIDLTGRYD